MQPYQKEIKRKAYDRGITRLYHFTKAVNVKSILRHGLLSRTDLEEQQIHYRPSDKIRLDGRLDAISLSVESINEDMLYSKQREYHGEWVIFGFDASILWTHECRFCWVNAANGRVRRKQGFLGGPWAFQKMFSDIQIADGSSYRVSQKRQDYEPTDRSAEVQVLEPIVPELIIGAVVSTADSKRELENLMRGVGRGIQVVIDRTIL